MVKQTLECDKDSMRILWLFCAGNSFKEGRNKDGQKEKRVPCI